jgi:NAD(P)-dependent dehydrogenase (short-subunit alcohol dehydrogenase family)
MRLAGKTAIVTGAARGIGQACAQRFAAEGARVVLADILQDEGEASAEAIRAAGGEASFVACDTGDASQARALIDTTVSRHGGLDVLVNNAGISTIADFLEVTEADFDAVLRVNLKGYFLVGQAAARAMAARDKTSGGATGSIINMSSVNAVMAIETIAPYVVSKGGVNQLTAVMALSLAKHNIRVNAIGPGTIETSMSGALLTDEAAQRRVRSRTPIGRFGQPDEIAGIALFLAGDDSSYVTGQVIYADGGRLRLNYTVPVD